MSADRPTVLTVEFTLEGTNREQVERCAGQLKEAALRLKAEYRRTVAISEHTEDISYER